MNDPVKCETFWGVVKGLLSSKKFLSMIVGTIVVGIMSHLNVDPELIKYTAGFFGVGIGAYGLADLGKEKAKIEANREKLKVQLDVKNTQSPSERLMS
jgi:hypothetical protein